MLGCDIPGMCRKVCNVYKIMTFRWDDARQQCTNRGCSAKVPSLSTLEFGPYAPTAGRTQHNQPPPELDRFLVSVMLLAVCLPHQPTWLQRMLLLISRKHSCELGTGGCGLEKLYEDILRDVCTPDRRQTRLLLHTQGRRKTRAGLLKGD